MQPLFPKVGTIASPDGCSFPLVTRRAKSMSLLTSSLMEDDSNLQFPDLNDPLASMGYIENLVLDVASHELAQALPKICKGSPTHHGGNKVTLSWDKHHVVANGYNDKHIQWFCNHLLSDLG